MFHALQSLMRMGPLFISYVQVSSESGWSPNPEFFAKRKFKQTKYGWFPVEDAFGGGALDPNSIFIFHVPWVGDDSIVFVSKERIVV